MTLMRAVGLDLARSGGASCATPAPPKRGGSRCAHNIERNEYRECKYFLPSAIVSALEDIWQN